jgi:hypothetical protein
VLVAVVAVDGLLHQLPPVAVVVVEAVVLL